MLYKFETSYNDPKTVLPKGSCVFGTLQLVSFFSSYLETIFHLSYWLNMDFCQSIPSLCFIWKVKKVYTVMEQVTNLVIQETAYLFCFSWIKEQLV